VHLLAELSRRLKQERTNIPRSIAVVDSRVYAQGGSAHGDPHPGFRVNMRTELHDIPGQLPFSDFLLRYAGGGENPPLRADLGRYATFVQQQATEKLTAARRPVTLVRDTVTGMGAAGDGYRLNLATGERIQTRAVVLALGNQPPVSPPNLRQFQRQTGRIRSYIGSSEFARDISARDNVLIVGAGPSGIDVARYLLDSGTTGRVDVVSTSGRLSTVLPVQSPTPGMLDEIRAIRDSAGHPGTVALTELSRLLLPIFRRYERRFSFEMLNRNRGNALTWIADQLALAESPRPTWLTMVEAVGRYGPQWWRLLSAKDKLIFQKKWQSQYHAIRYGMPISTARWIANQLAQGRLRVGKASRDILVTDQQVSLTAEFLPGGSEFAVYDWLVLATGPEYRLSRSESPLIRQILSTGLAKPYLIGDIDIGGFVTKDLELVELPNVFAMGALVRGEDFAVHSFPALARHARVIADGLRRLYSQV
jgi:uncharacterized NAD(P)/FAD-binding protein YdhS